MEKSKFPKIVLCISGLIAPRKADLEEITVGGMIQISPSGNVGIVEGKILGERYLNDWTC